MSRRMYGIGQQSPEFRAERMREREPNTGHTEGGVMESDKRRTRLSIVGGCNRRGPLRRPNPTGGHPTVKTWWPAAASGRGWTGAWAWSSAAGCPSTGNRPAGSRRIRSRVGTTAKRPCRAAARTTGTALNPGSTVRAENKTKRLN